MTEPTLRPAEASPTQLNDASVPRRPSLLPAFEPFSSSPMGLPRPLKRKLDDLLDEERKYYPTPVPTSSTGVLPSSTPPRQTRPGLQRTVSTLSERAPLGDVPALDLPATGEPVLMGRSSNSSDYQLSANRHISRVHIRASYHAPTSVGATGKVEVECLGWNGAKVHCRGEVVELVKNQVFVSDKPMAQIIVDVQDTRVMLVWPKSQPRDQPAMGHSSPWFLSESPSRRRATPGPALASSPPPFLLHRQPSPVSPTPRNNDLMPTFRCEHDDSTAVKVYEDHSSDEDAPHDPTPDLPLTRTFADESVADQQNDTKASITSSLSDPEDFSEHDEENDPIVLSFGPHGDNILDRFQSFQPTSPEHRRAPLKPSPNSPVRNAAPQRLNISPVKNHVINQLAFSRVHALPLSTIHSNLPAELRDASNKSTDPALTSAELKEIMDSIPCVGEISREGKDAAGKLLESEFYYVPEMDLDEMRRDTVTQSLGKTSIRAARKQHKQYYWKRPRH